jgi:hypothetical protein
MPIKCSSTSFVGYSVQAKLSKAACSGPTEKPLNFGKARANHLRRITLYLDSEWWRESMMASSSIMLNYSALLLSSGPERSACRSSLL